MTIRNLPERMARKPARFPPHRWTLEQWDRLVASGALDDQRVELLDGEIIDMSPQGTRHVASIGKCAKALSCLFDNDHYWIRIEAPLRIGINSEPEPDLAVVEGDVAAFDLRSHPTTALLVIEVSDSSLALDRQSKASLYASAGIADYWIINLIDRCCEVHREPIADATAPFGFRYREVTIHTVDKRLSPVAAPGSSVAVADLLA